MLTYDEEIERALDIDNVEYFKQLTPDEFWKDLFDDSFLDEASLKYSGVNVIESAVMHEKNNSAKYFFDVLYEEFCNSGPYDLHFYSIKLEEYYQWTVYHENFEIFKYVLENLRNHNLRNAICDGTINYIVDGKLDNYLDLLITSCKDNSYVIETILYFIFISFNVDLKYAYKIKKECSCYEQAIKVVLRDISNWTPSHIEQLNSKAKAFILNELFKRTD